MKGPWGDMSGEDENIHRWPALWLYPYRCTGSLDEVRSYVLVIWQYSTCIDQYKVPRCHSITHDPILKFQLVQRMKLRLYFRGLCVRDNATYSLQAEAAISVASE